MTRRRYEGSLLRSASCREAHARERTAGSPAPLWAAEGLGVRAAASDNLLDRAFEASAPNQKWVADFTYIWTAEGWLYVAAVVDLFWRPVACRKDGGVTSAFVHLCHHHAPL